MSRSIHHLKISSSQPGAVFRVTDGRAARVGTGMYWLDLALPSGLYTVSAMLGRSIESREVLLDRDQVVEFGCVSPSFGDRAFGVAPQVLETIFPHVIEGGANAFVTLHGPWRSGAAIDAGIVLDLDGESIARAAEGVVEKPAAGRWSWQLFRIPTEVPGIVTATRLVDGVRTSHVMPRFGDCTVWAAYPAPQALAAEGSDLPQAHYVRLRLTRQGAVPLPTLQSLSDQIFTALAGRTELPFSPPVLDLLYAEEGDPLLALAAAHVASLGLARDGLTMTLPQEAKLSASGTSQRRLDETHVQQMPVITAEKLHGRIRAWLEDRSGRAMADWPDFIAVRTLFRLDTRIAVRRPPVLLRSLDVLVEATHNEGSAAPGPKLDDSVWRTRFQISDSFAYLQWEPDSDSEELLRDQVQRSFDLEQELEQARRLLDRGRVSLEKGIGLGPVVFGALFQDTDVHGAAEGPQGATGPKCEPDLMAPVQAESEDAILAFLRKRAPRLRIPSSGVGAVADLLAKLRLKGA